MTLETPWTRQAIPRIGTVTHSYPDRQHLWEALTAHKQPDHQTMVFIFITCADAVKYQGINQSLSRF